MSRYIQLDVGYFTHRKTMRLRVSLGNDALWVMPALWCYALQNQPDGDFSKWSDQELSLAIGFTGDPSQLQQSMIASGYMTEGKQLHGWDERQSYARNMRERAVKAAAGRWEKEEEKERKKESKHEPKHEQASPKHEPSIAQASTKHPTGTGRCESEECSAYCVELGLPASDGEWFVAKMEGSGWLNGKSPVKSWKGTVRAWKLAGFMNSQRTKGSYSGGSISWSDVNYSKAQVAKLRDDLKFAAPEKRDELRAAIAKHEAVIGGGK